MYTEYINSVHHCAAGRNYQGINERLDWPGTSGILSFALFIGEYCVCQLAVPQW